MGFPVSLDRVGTVAGAVLGGLKQAVNAGWAYQPIPGNQGDLFEPTNPAQRRGADVADRVFGGIGVSAHNAATGAALLAPLNAQRERTPLLGRLRLDVPAGNSVAHLVVHARALGADWGVAGREAAGLRIYVDGQYHSDLVVLAERPGPYRVNLGTLAAGAHDVEVRAHQSAASTRPQVQLHKLSSDLLTGDAALADRYAPILQLRDMNAPGGRLEAHYSDTPLLLAPHVVHNPDKSTTITYYAMFSNEDGGTRMPLLLRETSRALDYEPVMQVVIGADGKPVPGGVYQGPLHKTYAFDGVWMGTRPVLRVATANNNFSERVKVGGALWSEATSGRQILSEAPVRPGKGRNPLDGGITWTTDRKLLLAHPWMLAVVGKELLREHRTIFGDPLLGVVRDTVGLTKDPKHSDLRRAVMLAPKPDPLRTALESGQPVKLRLRDGRSVQLRMSEPSPQPLRGAALMLPHGIVGSQVVGIEGPAGGVAHVIDPDFTPRELQVGAGR